MNNDQEHFEKRVSGQPLRPVPAGWRAEILAAARSAQAAPQVPQVAKVSIRSTLNSQLAALLWPHPKAWAGLAAVWVGIIAWNLSTQEGAPKLAEKSAPPSPEMVAELKQQRRMLAELVGSYETTDADRPRVFAPRPRSERREAGVA